MWYSNKNRSWIHFHGCDHSHLSSCWLFYIMYTRILFMSICLLLFLFVCFCSFLLYYYMWCAKEACIESHFATRQASIQLKWLHYHNTMFGLSRKKNPYFNPHTHTDTQTSTSLSLITHTLVQHSHTHSQTLLMDSFEPNMLYGWDFLSHDAHRSSNGFYVENKLYTKIYI